MQNRIPRSIDGMKPRQTYKQPEPTPQPNSNYGTSPVQPTEAAGSAPQPLPDISLATKTQPPKGKPAASRKRLFTWRQAVMVAGITLLSLSTVAGLTFWYLKNQIVVENRNQGAAFLQENADPNMLKGEGDGRINALLIGVDDAAGLADTIMLVSFDPIAKDVAMLSIPRDLWVDMGEFGSAKINAAHVYGEQYGYDGGGPQLLKDTVSRLLDVPIHYYARVNFDGFEKAIDIVGGIEVDVEQTLSDPYFPDSANGYEPLHITEGVQTMDGRTALRYARSRKTTSDFDRNRRQQDILLGLRGKITSVDTLSNPAKISRLLSTLGSNAKTDMRLEEMVRLSELGRGISESNITQSQLDASEDNFLVFANMYGQSALVPRIGDFSEIRKHVRTLMVDGYIRDENARVSILNGTDKPGLANETADILRSYGYNVVNIDNASDQNYTRTIIFNYNNDNPYTLRYLEQRFGVMGQRRQFTSQPGEDTYDIEIVIGSDYDPRF